MKSDNEDKEQGGEMSVNAVKVERGIREAQHGIKITSHPSISKQLRESPLVSTYIEDKVY